MKETKEEKSLWKEVIGASSTKKMFEKVEEENFKILIMTNNLAAVRAMLIVYQNQTEQEKKSKSSNIKNKKGFNNADASVVSEIAKSFIDERRGSYIRQEEVEVLKQRMPKYWRQVYDVRGVKNNLCEMYEDAYRACVRNLRNLSLENLSKALEKERLEKEDERKSYEQARERVRKYFESGKSKDLLDCESGKGCSYGICDECEIINEYNEEETSNDE